MSVDLKRVDATSNGSTALFLKTHVACSSQRLSWDVLTSFQATVEELIPALSY
jgi:hypothetical protein